MSDYDHIIVGQGLAGTSLDWQLRWHGQTVLVVDRDEPETASKIAAGLITPVTGQRFVKTWRWNEFWPAASEFYRRVEQETNARFFREQSMVRLFADERERSFFHAKRAAEYSDFTVTPDPLIDENEFSNRHGGFEMTSAGQLDVLAYLQASRRSFEAANAFRCTEFNWADLQSGVDWVEVPSLDVRAKRIIFCQGFAATNNPAFAQVKFDATKGEILTLRIPQLRERRVIHRGIWLAHWRDDLYRAGSTYRWSPLDCQPTPEAREEICTRLRAYLKLDFEVVEHRAAVRPIVIGRHPVMGLHPENERIGFFNGLASKGSLQAPLLAAHFAEFLTGQCLLDPKVDLSRRMDLSA